MGGSMNLAAVLSLLVKECPFVSSEGDTATDTAPAEAEDTGGCEPVSLYHSCECEEASSSSKPHMPEITTVYVEDADSSARGVDWLNDGFSGTSFKYSHKDVLIYMSGIYLTEVTDPSGCNAYITHNPPPWVGAEDYYTGEIFWNTLCDPIELALKSVDIYNVPADADTLEAQFTCALGYFGIETDKSSMITTK